jgi:hypothetical protein
LAGHAIARGDRWRAGVVTGRAGRVDGGAPESKGDTGRESVIRGGWF